jgi:transposase-like protein
LHRSGLPGFQDEGCRRSGKGSQKRLSATGADVTDVFIGGKRLVENRALNGIDAQAIAAMFPKTEVPLCIVRLVRNSARFVPYKDRKAVIAGLKKICLSPSAELAAEALEEFAGERDKKYPMIAKSWRSRWNEVIPFFKFSPEIRKAVYTTNAWETKFPLSRSIIRFKKS